VAVALMPGAVGGAALPRSAGGDGQQFGQTIATDPAKPSPDDMERLTPRFQALLRETGALGTYPRPDGTVVVVVPASGSSRFTVQDAAALGIAVAIESRDIEVDDVARIESLVAKVEWSPAPDKAPPSVLFDAMMGKVVILSDAPASEFAPIMEQFPGKIALEPALVPVSRYADYEPHWGGAQMVEPGSPRGYDCTSGFSVLNVNAKPRMVTAAHCFALNDTVNSPGGHTFGTVTKRDNFPANDSELVGASWIATEGSIYVGNFTGTQRKVSGAGDAGVSTQYCFSGATSSEECGLYMSDSDYAFCWHSSQICTSHTQRFLGPVGSGACRHDSGAPFYRYGPDGRVQIRGIVVGGTDFGDDIARCKQEAKLVIVEKWSKIRDANDVTIMTMP